MAKRRRNEITVDLDGVGQTTRGELSLAEATARFLKDIRGLAKHTQRWHRENLRALEKALSEQNIVVTDVKQLTPELLRERFVFYMFDELHRKANTVNGRVRTVQKLVHYLFEEGLISLDYSADIPKVRADRVIIPTFSEDQIDRLLRQPDRHTFTGLRDYTLMLLLLETGMRISECIGITMRDIDMKDGRILVHGKGAKERFVPFQTSFRRVLRDYLKVRGNVSCEALFLTVDNRPISKRYVQELIQAYGEKAKLQHVRVSPHTFRHTMAKFYILAGGDIFSLQKILGHSSLETVRMYVEMFSSDVQQQHQKYSYLETRLHLP